ncbi:MAG: RidA family protein [Klebsiella huaxiensis]|uniref:RidA family protein n=1 Tax=Klebsiella TaxID=570 RepID=UPI0015F724AB|nr:MULTISPECIES: RidA family protein [Klebsiella]MBA7933830.1 RidA family protein [Klebsiella sp. RHBSTW-00215]WEJ91195.1 MAG: RidA family protein [Klebsiella huaxiensis]
MNIEARIVELGITLSEPTAPKFSYVPIKQTGNLLYSSGNDCRVNGELIYQGALGRDLSIEQGQAAARQCIINILSSLKGYLGDLDRVSGCIKMLGFVQSVEGFKEQPLVMNSASDLLIAIFGESGKHARSAIGTNTLPFDTPVEIELIFEIKD